MRRTTAYSLVFTLFSLAIFAQESKVEVEIGPKVLFFKSMFKTYLDTDSGSVYTLSTFSRTDNRKKEKFTLRKYNIAELEEENEWEFESFDYKEGDAKYNSYLTNDKGFHLFFDCFDSKSDMKYLLHRRIDRNGNITPVKVLASTATEKEEEGQFTLTHSKDSTKTLVRTGREEDDDRMHALSLAVFDHDLNKKWEEIALLPLPDKVVLTVTKAVISNDGEVFLLGYLQPKASVSFEDQDKSAITPEYRIYRIHGKEEIRKYDLSEFGKIFHNTTIEADVNGKLIFMGLYSDSLSKEDVAGSVFVSLDQGTLQPQVENVQAYSEELLSHFTKEKSLIDGLFDKSPEGFKGYQFKDFIAWPDSSLTILMEKNYYILRAQGTSDMYYTYKEYYSEDILALGVDARGKLQWTTVIPKKQRGFITRVSHAVIRKGDVLHLILNTHMNDVQNFNEGKEPIGMDGRSSRNNFAVSRVKLKRDGRFEYEKLLNAEDFDKFVLPVKNHIVVDPETILTVHTRGLKTRMAKLRIRN